VNDVQEYKGSPFLCKEFKNGQVFDTYGTPQNLDMRFNVYNNEVEMLNDKNEIVTIQKECNIDKIIIGYDTIVIDFCSENKRISRKYFLLIYSGKTKIYNLPLVYAQVEPNLVDGKTVDIPIFGPIVSKYFIKSGTREARYIKDRKTFLKILGNKRAEMEQFIKTNNLSLSRKDDLLKAISYYDRL